MNEQANWQHIDDFLDQTNRSLPIEDSERFVSYALEDLWPEWQKEGRCWDQGTEFFFGDDEQQPTMSIKQVRNASKLCDVCPVFRDCLTHALTVREEYGVWAGTSGRVRRKLMRLIDDGIASVEKVVEDFSNGQGYQYAEVVRADFIRERDDLLSGSGELAREGSVRAEAEWEIA